MKRIAKIAAVFVLAAIMVSLASCGRAAKNTAKPNPKKSASSAAAVDTVSTTGGFSLPYNNAASFNPLLPTSQLNLVLWPLMYDCVSEPGTNYDPVMRLADSVTVNGTSVIIKLKTGVAFTDGSSLSGEDVVYTYNFIRNHPESPYFSRLSSVTNIWADGHTVNMTLSAPDPLFANMLDIPIIKKGSDATGDAVGSGLYRFVRNGVNAVLTLNPAWYGGAKSNFKTIPLVNIPNANAIMTSLAIGEVNYVYSDNGSGAATTTASTTTSPVNLNRLLYIGINASRSHLNNAHYRAALSYAIDRKLLVSQTFSNRAVACALPFNPSWSQIKKDAAKNLSSDFTNASAQLTQAGGTGGTGVTFSLLVNSDDSARTAAARFVISCFSKAGVNVTLKAVPFAAYSSLISNGNYDMYLGEVKLQNDLDISPLLASGGSAAFRTLANSGTLAVFGKWRAGSATIANVTDTFKNEMPFIPLCYRIGTTTYTKGLSGVTPTDSDVFFNFQNWSQH